MTSPIKVPHLRQIMDYLSAKIIIEFDRFTALGPVIEQCPLADVAGEHFFQAHSFAAQLQTISIIDLAGTMLVFNRIGLPTSSPAYQRNSILSCVKFDDVTIADDSQLRENTRRSRSNKVSPRFSEAWWS